MSKICSMIFLIVTFGLTILILQPTFAIESHQLDFPVGLRIGETAEIDSELKMTLLSVEDSRCPIDVTCIWEGTISAKVQLTKGAQDLGVHTIQMNVIESEEQTFDGYYIRLTNASPYPTSTATSQTDYVLTFFVSRAETVPIDSPYKQFKAGVPFHEIKCDSGLRLTQKYDGKPACVKPDTYSELIKRNWVSDIIKAIQSDIVEHKSSLESPVFFTLQGQDAIGSIDGKTLKAGPQMTYIVVSTDSSLVLATSSASDTVFAYDDVGNKIVTIPVGKTPKGIMINPDGNLALVANEKSGTVSLLDTSTLQVTKEIPVGEIPHNIKFSPDGNIAYVTIQGDDEVAVIDMQLLEKTDSIPVGKLPHNLDMTPDGRYLVTSNIGTNDVAVIDLESNEIIKRIPISAGHHGIDVSPDGKRIYASGIGSDVISVIDVGTLELVKTITVGKGPHGLRTSTDSTMLYVGITQTSEMVVIDTQNLKITKTIPIGKTPFWISIPGNS